MASCKVKRFRFTMPDIKLRKGLAKHGSEYVRELFLRPSISGDQVACLGVSEPGAGSDVAQEGIQSI